MNHHLSNELVLMVQCQATRPSGGCPGFDSRRRCNLLFYNKLFSRILFFVERCKMQIQNEFGDCEL